MTEDVKKPERPEIKDYHTEDYQHVAGQQSMYDQWQSYHTAEQKKKDEAHEADKREMLERIDAIISEKYCGDRNLTWYDEGRNDGLDMASRIINAELSKLKEPKP